MYSVDKFYTLEFDTSAAATDVLLNFVIRIALFKLFICFKCI